MPALPASPPRALRFGGFRRQLQRRAGPGVHAARSLAGDHVDWSLLSAIVWLFYGALAASLYGTVNAIIAVVVSTVIYGAVSIFMTRIGIRYGLNTTMLTKAIFGKWGAMLTALPAAATVLYDAIFESSTLAVAFQVYFEAGDIRIWYAVVVLGMLPLMLGRVQDWMAKLNGVLLPFYFIGLVIVIVAAAVKFDANSWTSFEGIVPDEGAPCRGGSWASCCTWAS